MTWDLAHDYYSGRQIKEKEMGGACGTHWIKERFLPGFRGEN